MVQSDMATLQLQKYLEKNTIKHPTALLHFERQLSDFEQGILFLCVHIVARTERAKDGFYYLNKSLVRSVMRQEGNQNYARINDAVREISKTDLKFNFLGEDRTFDDYEAPLIIGRATSKKRGVIAFEVHPRIEKLIKDPRVFSRLNIYFISALADVRRGYSFYVLFRDFVDRTKTTEVTLDYWELRRYLGIEDEIYRDFKLFKRKVLKPLIEAVNERTDLKLSYEPVKTNRQLTHLHFKIEPQAWQLALFEKDYAVRIVEELSKTFDGAVLENTSSETIEIDKAEDSERKRLIDHCVKIGVTSRTVERALKKYGVEGVGEILAQTQKRFAKMDNENETYDEKNYLARMLNEGAGVKSAKQREDVEKEKLKVEKAKAKLEADKVIFRDAVKFHYLHNLFTDAQRDRDRELKERLRNEDDQEALRTEFCLTLKSKPKKRADFEKLNWSSLLCLLEIRDFAIRYYGVEPDLEAEFFQEHKANFLALEKQHEKIANSFRREKLNDAVSSLSSLSGKSLDTAVKRFY